MEIRRTIDDSIWRSRVIKIRGSRDGVLGTSWMRISSRGFCSGEFGESEKSPARFIDPRSTHRRQPVNRRSRKMKSLTRWSLIGSSSRTTPALAAGYAAFPPPAPSSPSFLLFRDYYFYFVLFHIHMLISDRINMRDTRVYRYYRLLIIIIRYPKTLNLESKLHEMKAIKDLFRSNGCMAFNSHDLWQFISGDVTWNFDERWWIYACT